MYDYVQFTGMEGIVKFKRSFSELFARAKSNADSVDDLTHVHSDRLVMTGGDLGERHLWTTAEKTGDGWNVYRHRTYPEFGAAPEKSKVAASPVTLEKAIELMRSHEKTNLGYDSNASGLHVRKALIGPKHERGSEHIVIAEKLLQDSGAPQRRATPTAKTAPGKSA